MTEIKVDISDLKSEGKKVVEELVEYLNKKTEAEVDTVASELIVKGNEEKVSRSHLRVLLRKFLHKQELKKGFRVISGREDSWIVKEKKTYSEE